MSIVVSREERRDLVRQREIFSEEIFFMCRKSANLCEFYTILKKERVIELPLFECSHDKKNCVQTNVIVTCSLYAMLQPFSVI